MSLSLYLVFLGWGAGPRFLLVLEIFHLKISSCPFWDTCTYEGLSAFFNAINCYIILKGVLLPNTWASQQHEYLEHSGPEPVASKKMSLEQVVPNFTGQVVSFKILRIFR